jgi:hypothetical protein
MEEINSMESRKLTPSQNMKRLEKAVIIADQRIRMRRDVTTKVSLCLGTAFAFPLGAYMIYHIFAPYGVMQNHKSTSGAYMFWAQNFLYRAKSHQEIYRPEFYFKETTSSLHVYSKRIEERRKNGDLPEGVHHPTAWH